MWVVGVALLLVLAAYLPSYLSPAHRCANSYRASAAFWPGWHWIWTNILQMPLAEVWLHNAEVDPSVQLIYCSHPHGVCSLVPEWDLNLRNVRLNRKTLTTRRDSRLIWQHHMGPMMCPPVCVPGLSFERISPGSSRRELATTVMFRIPLIRELALAVGCCDAGCAVVDRVLVKGLSVGLMVGGEQEQILSQRGEHAVYVQKRKGIMKLALHHGVSLVPCYCFGETDTYHQSRFALRFRQWLCSTVGIAITLAYGRNPLLPFLPIPIKLVQVTGTPIHVEKMVEPTPDAVERLHAAYIAGLRAVFDEHKGKAGYADAELVVV